MFLWFLWFLCLNISLHLPLRETLEAAPKGPPAKLNQSPKGSLNLSTAPGLKFPPPSRLHWMRALLEGQAQIAAEVSELLWARAGEEVGTPQYLQLSSVPVHQSGKADQKLQDFSKRSSLGGLKFRVPGNEFARNTWTFTLAASIAELSGGDAPSPKNNFCELHRGAFEGQHKRPNIGLPFHIDTRTVQTTPTRKAWTQSSDHNLEL